MTTKTKSLREQVDKLDFICLVRWLKDIILWFTLQISALLWSVKVYTSIINTEKYIEEQCICWRTLKL